MKDKSLTKNGGDILILCLTALLLCVVLFPILLYDGPWPSFARDLLAARGFVETGAKNLVSATYLGYRAYDTLLETVVLLVAVAGVAMIAPAQEREQPPALKGRRPRIDLISFVAGKLSPLVLLLGCYVMLYGHASPGGGFQGGVVLASGVVFLFLGRRFTSGAPDFHSRLPLTEALAFLVVLLAFSAGIPAGPGFSGNVLPPDGPIPMVAFVILLNLSIGLKVGAGTALMCILMLEDL